MCSENKGAELICTIVFVYGKRRFSHDTALIWMDNAHLNELGFINTCITFKHMAFFLIL